MKLFSNLFFEKGRWLLVLSFAVLFAWAAWKAPSSWGYAPCVSPVQLKMGDRVFYIPRYWRLDLALIHPGNIRDLCYASAPVEVSEWVLFVPASLLLRGTPDRGPGSLPDLRIQVYATDNNFHSLYQDLQKFLQLQKIKITDLPRRNSFRMWQWQDWPRTHIGKQFLLSRNWDLPGKTTIYIADDPALPSSKGEPAIFVCKPALSGGVSYEKCRTSIWDGQVSFYVDQIETRYISKEKFKSLYEELLKLRRTLLTNTAVSAFEKTP